MNVNDIICVGAEPIAMVDYLAVEQVRRHVHKDDQPVHPGARGERDVHRLLEQPRHVAPRLYLRQYPGQSLTQIAYECGYYDQAHFIRDFKEFTGTTPKDFLENGEMALSSLFYKKD